LQNSWGLDVGDNGYHYVSREVINKNVSMYGAYMLVDLEKEKAEHMIENGIKESDSWFIKTLIPFWLFIKAIFTPNEPPSEEK
jgi:C1A family cysteine protease